MRRIKRTLERIKQCLNPLGLYLVPLAFFFLISLSVQVGLEEVVFMTFFASYGLDKLLEYEISMKKSLAMRKWGDKFEGEYFDLYWNYNKIVLCSITYLMFTVISILKAGKVFEKINKTMENGNIIQRWISILKAGKVFEIINTIMENKNTILSWSIQLVFIMMIFVLCGALVGFVCEVINKQEHELIWAKKENFERYSPEEEKLLEDPVRYPLLKGLYMKNLSLNSSEL